MEHAAARLVYKSIGAGASPYRDEEYRALLNRVRAEPAFMVEVEGTASAMELVVLDISERGMILAPSSRESRFALRVADFRKQWTPEQKTALAIAHLAIAAVFFPTTDWLDDDSRNPLPATVPRFRDTLVTLAARLADAPPDFEDDRHEGLRPGWTYIKQLPAVWPGGERATLKSVDGVIRLALGLMVDYGLVRVARERDEDRATYTARYRLRVHLRELTLPGLFNFIRDNVRP